MKKDRNSMGYPVYPNMGGMPMPLPMYPNMNTYGGFYPCMNTENNSSEINALASQVNNLEKRVSALENMTKQNYSTNYNTTNYQMM